MRDEAFEALCQVWGVDWEKEITDDQRGRVNAALKQLRSIYPDDLALPMMIHERAAAWAVVYPGIPLTPQALTTNWSSIIQAAEETHAQTKRKQTEKSQMTNAHARRGCQTCGDDHFVTVGYDDNGYEQVAPCPDCGPRGDSSYWVQRRRIEVMGPDKVKEMLDG
jgi:hypothetical protein